MGTPEGFAALGEAFADAVRLDLATRTRKFNFWVVCGDQAVFNYAVHSGALDGRNVSVAIEPRGSGVINTLYRFRHESNLLSARIDRTTGLVLNEDRVTPSPVVHMHDRMPLAVQRSMRELRRWQEEGVKLQRQGSI